MYGKNDVYTQFCRDDTLLVNDIFPTIQGEGPDAGRLAIFVRLAKCNLRCFFCDTDFEHGSVRDQSYIAEVVQQQARDAKTNLVVITGGEPLLQNVIPFISKCNAIGLDVSIETAGTLWVNGLQFHFISPNVYSRYHTRNLIVCSPKTPKINDKLVPLIGAYKYIVAAGDCDPKDGLPIGSTQISGRLAPVFRPPSHSKVPIYIQPRDDGDEEANARNLTTAVRVVREYGYRLSLQLHKIAGVP